jgi:hypothetical protein
MKNSLARTFLVSAGALLLRCGAEDSNPPPVSQGQLNPPPASSNTAPGAMPSGTMPAASAPSSPTPAGNEGQPAAGAPLSPAEMPNGGMSAGGAPGMNAGGAPGMNAGGAPPMNAGGAPPVTPPPLDLVGLVGALDGHLFSVACGDTPNTDDCAGEGWRSSLNPGEIHACVGGRLDAQIDFPIGGEAGAAYDVSMHFYGVMEPRNYGAVVTREAQGRPNLNTGGTPTPFASMVPGAGNYLSTGDNNYNTYELHVLDQNQREVGLYFLNADTQTGHYTMGISYQKTIELIGGGTLRLQVADANCRQIKNCGAGGVPCTGKARVVDISAASPQPQNLQQPGLGKDPEHSGQWFLMDVLSFAPAQ